MQNETKLSFSWIRVLQGSHETLTDHFCICNRHRRTAHRRQGCKKAISSRGRDGAPSHSYFNEASISEPVLAGRRQPSPKMTIGVALLRRTIQTPPSAERKPPFYSTRPYTHRCHALLECNSSERRKGLHPSANNL